MSEFNNTGFQMSEEDKALLAEIRANKAEEQAKQDKLNARKTKLDTFLADEDFKDLYNNGLKDILDKAPSMIDNEETFSFAINQAKASYLNKNSQQTEPKHQPIQNNTPLTQAPIQTDNTLEEEGKVLQGMSYKEMVAAGIDKPTAMLAKAFPPKKQIRIK